MTLFTPNIVTQFFDNNGDPLSAGSVYTYSAGTTNLLATFTTPAGDIQNTNPIILDAAGKADIYISPNTNYKFVVYDKDGVLLERVEPVFAEKLNTPFVVVSDFGAVGDGITNDTAAFIAALASGASEIKIPAGKFVITETLVVPPGVSLIGSGVDYWDTYRPNPIGLPKSDAKGTVLYFSGTGPKQHSISNTSNERPVKTVGGVNFPFTSFTNDNAAAGSSATPKSFSVGIKLARNSQLKNLRICPSFTGITGYLNASLNTLADDWDVGIWAPSAAEATIENVQGVGYWRMASLMVTENDGTYIGKGNSERLNVTKYFGQGRRGLLIRNAPQVDVISNTTSTITVSYNSSSRFIAAGSFTLSGSSTVYTFTGSTFSSPNVVLTGVTPSLPAGVALIRAPNAGNGFSASVFNDSVFCSLDHTSGAASSTFGIGEAGALEADGYPLRAVVFNNTKFQTTYDKLCGLIGDVRDWKFTNCQFENGSLIAYNPSETIGYSSNLQLVNTEIQSSVDRTEFNPRDAFISMDQFPTLFTDGTFYVKPWRAQETSIWGENITLKNMSGNVILTLFSGSKNVLSAADITAGDELISTSNTRPTVTNVVNCGTAAYKWKDTYTEQVRPGPAGSSVIWTAGAGSPEGVVTAVRGSLFTRTDGGASTTLYVKESGSGNTGWIPK